MINLGHDNKGRTTSVGSYLSGVTYNGLGQVIGTTLGNGVTEVYGYDANRMQLSSQTTTQSGGSTSGLMNLTYSYQASAAQMGAGTNAGNAGQVLSISGTIWRAENETGGVWLKFVDIPIGFSDSICPPCRGIPGSKSGEGSITSSLAE